VHKDFAPVLARYTMMCNHRLKATKITLSLELSRTTITALSIPLNVWIERRTRLTFQELVLRKVW
jgi:hypothetical protein